MKDLPVKTLTILILAGLAVVVTASGTLWMHGYLDDTDSYERLAWLEWSIKQGSLQHYIFTKEYWPQGFEIHWTLPMNILIYTIALIARLWSNWHQALEFAAILISPIQFVLFALATVYLAKKLGFSAIAQGWSVVCCNIAPGVLAYTRVGRVSHHTLSVAIATLTLALAIAMARKPTVKNSVFAAMALVLCMWESMETLPIVAIAAGFIIISQIFYKRSIKGPIAFLIALIFSVAIVLAIDPDPKGMQSFAIDRFSLFHALISLVIVNAVLISVIGNQYISSKLKIFIAVVIGTLAVTLLFIPFAIDHFPHIPNNQVFYQYFWNQIIELKSIWQEPQFFSLLIFPQLPALIVSAVQIRGNRFKKCFWAYIFLAILAQTILGAVYLRLAPYGCILSTVVIGAICADFFSKNRTSFDQQLNFIYILTSVMVGIRVLAFVLNFALGLNQAVEPFQIGQEFADKIQKSMPNNSTIAADLYLNAEILWRTNLQTIAGPYHRNEKGIVVLGEIFQSSDMSLVYQLLDKNRVQAILIYRFNAYDKLDSFTPNSFRNHLISGNLPSFVSKDNSLSQGNFSFFWVGNKD